MAKFCENGNEWESFVYVPKKPCCLKEDGTCDYDKYQSLLGSAKQGDCDAQVKIFEQHQGIWKRIIKEYSEKFEKTFMGFEDLQQEAFVALMLALRQYDNIQYTKSFSEYYANVFVHHLIDIIKVQSKQVNINSFTCSLDVRDEEGNPIYDIPVNDEKEYFADYYPQVKALLTAREFMIVMFYYVDGVSLRLIANQLGLSYGYIRNVIISIKNKLQILNTSIRDCNMFLK